MGQLECVTASLLSKISPNHRQKKNVDSSSSCLDVSAASKIRRMFEERDEREEAFENSRFISDPGLGILLEMYLAKITQRRICVSDLCIASRVLHTTVLLWISLYEKRNLIRRIPDRIDARRIYLELTPVASERLAKYLAKQD